MAALCHDLVWGADSGAYMFGKNCLAKHKLAPGFLSDKTHSRVYPAGSCYGCRDLMGLRYVGESECCACYLADLLCGGGSGFWHWSDLTEETLF